MDSIFTQNKYKIIRRQEGYKKDGLIFSEYEPFSLFPLGYPAEERSQQDRFDESRIHYM